MGDMPRPRPLYLQRQIQGGKTYWYVRVDRGPKVRVRGEYGSREFMSQYEAAVHGEPLPKPGRARTGTLRWLWERYRDTSAWADLSQATKRQRENIMAGVLKTAGDSEYGKIDRPDIVKGKDARRATPAQARNFLDTMRGLFRWALSAGMVKIDPTAGVQNPKRPEGAGFPAWTLDDVARYEARWPTGTRERVWLHTLLYTGLRRGDAVVLGRQHQRQGGIVVIKTEKTRTEVTIPILPVLAATLAQGPCGEITYICGPHGRPLTKETFGNLFRTACRAAGVSKSAHGLRKLAATVAAENGATVAELEALFGWTGGTMASLYTRSADRQRLAIGSAHKLIPRTPADRAMLQADNPRLQPQETVNGCKGL